MKVILGSAKVSGVCSGMVSEIKIFKIDNKQKIKTKVIDDDKNYVYEMTDKEYTKWFTAYYGFEPTCAICDICGIDMSQNEKTYLIVHDIGIGNGWFEPRYAVCSKCYDNVR